MFRTNDFNISKFDMFKILVRSHLKKRWWLVLFLLFYMLIYNKGKVFDNVYLVLLLLMIFSPIVTYIYFYISDAYKHLFKQRYFEIDIENEKMTLYSIDGNSKSFMFKNVLKFEKTKKYYIFYITRFEFVYFPYDCFVSNIDKEIFEKNIISRFKK
jgi:hypothetical protein